MDGINEDYVNEVAYLGVVCDNDCGERLSGDFVVRTTAVGIERYEAIYRHAEKQGWRVYRQKNLTYCPDCDDLMMAMTDLARGDDLP